MYGYVTRAADGASVSVLTQTKTRYFTNTMPGAPAANLASLGGMIALLDACLVNGLGSPKTLGAGAMTRVGSTVTVAQPAHAYGDYSVISIAGASDPAYNGAHRIVVADANTYSFQLDPSLTPVTPAVGTITTQVPSAGWTKPFGATNKGVYRPADGPRHYLRVDDTFAVMKAKVRAYRNMTDVDTGTFSYPDPSKVLDKGCCWMKPAGGGFGWTVVADDKGAHVIVDTNNGNSGVTAYYFGWFKETFALDADAASLLSIAHGNTYISSGSDGTQNPENTRWGSTAITNDLNQATEANGVMGYLAKSFDGAFDGGVPFTFLSYAQRADNASRLSLFNTQYGNSHSALYVGNNAGSGTAAGLRGYVFQTPFLLEPSYLSGNFQVRGTMPLIQCLSSFSSQANDRKVFRAVDRYGAVLSVLSGYDSWGVQQNIRATLIPLGNWEDVL